MESMTFVKSSLQSATCLWSTLFGANWQPVSEVRVSAWISNWIERRPCRLTYPLQIQFPSFSLLLRTVQIQRFDLKFIFLNLSSILWTIQCRPHDRKSTIPQYILGIQNSNLIIAKEFQGANQNFWVQESQYFFI